MGDVWVLVTDVDTDLAVGHPVTARLVSGPSPGHVAGEGEVLAVRVGEVGTPFALRSTDDVSPAGAWWHVSAAGWAWDRRTPSGLGPDADHPALIGELPVVAPEELPPHWDAATIGAIPAAEKAQPDGVATLDQDGLVPVDQLPAAQGGGVQSVSQGAGMLVDATDPANPVVAANVGTGSGQVAAGDDSRFADARTPTVHAASHATGGADALTPAAIGAATVADVQARLEVAQDLADLHDAPTARQNLGLGSSATRDVGTTASDVAAGDRGLPDASGVADGWVATVDDEGWIVAPPPTLPNPSAVPLQANPQAGSHTLASSDAGKMVEVASSSAATVTVPPHSTIALPVGCVVSVCQTGTGTVTIAGGAGVTVHAPNGADTSAQWSIVTVWQQATDVWVVSGDTA